MWINIALLFRRLERTLEVQAAGRHGACALLEDVTDGHCRRPFVAVVVMLLLVSLLRGCVMRARREKGRKGCCLMSWD
jgi:hypothetical protein